MASKLEIITGDITQQEVDCIVNAAKSSLQKGTGVCGAVFEAAGEEQLTKACAEIGHCHTGSAVITPGFQLKAPYIIHAVGPRWVNGNIGESERLYSCYRESMELAKLRGCESIAFPLISSGVYGYPKDKAFQVAIQAITDFQYANQNYEIDAYIVSIDEEITKLGQAILAELRPEEERERYVFFWKSTEENGIFSARYKTSFSVEGIRYHSAEQYYMAKKALLFKDIEQYFRIMNESDPRRCKSMGQMVRGFAPDVWSACREEVSFNGNYAKFAQNPELRAALLETGSKMLVFANPHDTDWGIALKADDPDAANPERWKGRNLQGKILLRVRAELKFT